MHTIIAGGGVAGLSSALILARSGHRATLLEQDPVIDDATWEASFAWTRKGIPHFHQPHAFIPRGRKVLRDVLPDVYDTLLAAGAADLEVWRKAPSGPLGELPAEDLDLVYMCVRRELIEWALRKAVLAEPNITVRSQTSVIGLLGDHGPIPLIQGVETSAGEHISGDLVVDALGRRSPLPEWLALLGGLPQEVETSECNAVSYGRHFQIRDGNQFPEGPWLFSPRGDLGYAAFTTFIGDNQTFAVLLLVPTWDRELRQLRGEEAFMAACRSIPLLLPLVDPHFAEPITPVLPMGGLQNTLRNYAPNGRPVALGVVPVGDAYCHTDPSFALGLSMSLIHPVELAHALEAHPGDPEKQVRAYFASTMPETAERFALARDTDNARAQVWQGEKLDPTRRSGSFPLFMLVAASAVGARDPEVFRKATRRTGFLDRTAIFDDDVELQERVERLFAEIMVGAPRMPVGPSRDALLDLIRPVPELA
ncbi:MAG: FAD-dependent oxidoreductase [Chloroflexota bacterium]